MDPKASEPEPEKIVGEMPPAGSGSLPLDVTSPSTSDSPSDGHLVGRVLDGHKASFDVLIRRYQRQAVAVSYRLLGNSHDALEVTQDAFLKAFTSLSTLQTPAAFGGWLMRIVS